MTAVNNVLIRTMRIIDRDNREGDKQRERGCMPEQIFNRFLLHTLVPVLAVGTILPVNAGR